MAERRFSQADEALGRALRAIGADVAYPPSPPIVPEVLERLIAERSEGTRPRLPAVALWSRRRLLVLVATGILVILALAFAARLLIGAAEIRVQPGATPGGPPLGPGALGAPAAVEAVEREVGFEVGLPLGPEPDEAYVFEAGGGNGALLAWSVSDRYPRLPGTPWGLALIEVPGDDQLLVKDVNRFEDTREVQVDGRRAFWIHAPHELHVVTDEGTETFGVRGNVLIWADGAVTFRLETSLPLAEALALAETVG